MLYIEYRFLAGWERAGAGEKGCKKEIMSGIWQELFMLPAPNPRHRLGYFRAGSGQSSQTGPT